MREQKPKPKPKISVAAMWTIGTFLFAIFSDVCFQYLRLYVLGIASVIFAVVSAIFSIFLIGCIIGFGDD